MKTDIVDLILFINGNFARIPIDVGEVGNFKKLLVEKMKSEKEEVIFINQTFFRNAKLDGFYFTDHYEPPKSLDTETFNKLIKKTTQQIDGGEEWKG